MNPLLFPSNMFLPEIVGQDHLKQKLAFYYSSFQKDGFMPTICFDAPKGEGKTMFLMEMAKLMKKPAMLVNCATIKNKTELVDEVLGPASVSGGITILLDEIHALNSLTQTPLLTVLAPNKDRFNSLTFNGQTMDFNFHHVTFLCATTNLEKILSPLKDRLRIFSLTEYNNQDIGIIIQRKLEIPIDYDLLFGEIINYVRINPRAAIFVADDIKIYCNIVRPKKFTSQHWEELKKKLTLLPYGLMEQEVKLLQVIREAKAGARLTYLASRMLKDNRSIQDMERYLFARDLIVNAESKRKITNKGLECLDLIGV